MTQIEDPLESILESVYRNENAVLTAMHTFTSLSQNLNALSTLLYDPSNQIVPAFFKSFRKVYEDCESLSEVFQRYESNNQEFLRQREQCMNEQIRLLDAVANQQTREEDPPNKKSSNGKFRNRNNTRTADLQGEDRSSLIGLKKQVSHLMHVLQKNDLQFEAEIKKYNNRLYEMQQVISNYQMELARLQELPQALEELEWQVIRLREEKNRDQLIIQNMAKKIRIYEKERRGKDAFLSPETTSRVDRSRFVSPEPSLYNFNLARSNVGSFHSGRQIKFK